RERTFRVKRRYCCGCSLQTFLTCSYKSSCEHPFCPRILMIFGPFAFLVLSICSLTNRLLCTKLYRNGTARTVKWTPVFVTQPFVSLLAIALGGRGEVGSHFGRWLWSALGWREEELPFRTLGRASRPATPSRLRAKEVPVCAVSPKSWARPL